MIKAQKPIFLEIKDFIDATRSKTWLTLIYFFKKMHNQINYILQNDILFFETNFRLVFEEQVSKLGNSFTVNKLLI